MLGAIQAKQGEIKPTHLMYKSNLSHGQMTGYLEGLVSKDLVRKVQRKTYEYIIITDKGCDFVQKLREMREFEKAFGL
jgi:predicted transcriptional regulator